MLANGTCAIPTHLFHGKQSPEARDCHHKAYQNTPMSESALISSQAFTGKKKTVKRTCTNKVYEVYPHNCDQDTFQTPRREVKYTLCGNLSYSFNALTDTVSLFRRFSFLLLCNLRRLPRLTANYSVQHTGFSVQRRRY